MRLPNLIAAIHRPSLRDSAKFALTTALFGTFFDAAIGHAIIWGNDPYWSYWIHKSFLIATVFGFGTAWLGAGERVGVLLTLAHGVLLEIYYWSFAPVGLPSHPEWLSLYYIVTGTVVHTTEVYTGYLLALWLWRRRERVGTLALDERRSALRALVMAAVIVVAAGGLTSLALRVFPGLTWFLAQFIVTFTVLLVWWSHAGRDARAAVAGGVLLALVWGVHNHYVEPIGLPDRPPRVLDPSPPPAGVRWLGFRELWAVSVPIALLVMVAALLFESGHRLRVRLRLVHPAREQGSEP